MVDPTPEILHNSSKNLAKFERLLQTSPAGIHSLLDLRSLQLYRQPQRMMCYSFLSVFNSNSGFISLGFQCNLLDLNDLLTTFSGHNDHADRYVRLLAWSFFLVLYNNDCSKNAPFLSTSVLQTDRQVDRRRGTMERGIFGERRPIVKYRDFLP